MVKSDILPQNWVYDKKKEENKQKTIFVVANA